MTTSENWHPIPADRAARLAVGLYAGVQHLEERECVVDGRGVVEMRVAR